MGEKFPIEYLINLLTLKIKSLEIKYWLARSFLVAAIYTCVHISLFSKSNQINFWIRITFLSITVKIFTQKLKTLLSFIPIFVCSLVKASNNLL